MEGMVDESTGQSSFTGTFMIEYRSGSSVENKIEQEITTTATVKVPLTNCYQHANYDVSLIIISAICIGIGIIICFFGYRFFKATLFLIGFLFTSLLTYFCLDLRHQFPILINVAISVAAGVFVGIGATLVRHTGLCLTGFASGALIGTVICSVWRSFANTPSVWATIGGLIGHGVLLALISLKWQRVAFILNTSFIGATLLVSALDYFINQLAIIDRAWEAIINRNGSIVLWEGICWYGWLVLSVWPCLSALGCIVQWHWTSVGHQHKTGCPCWCKERTRQNIQVSDDVTDRCKHMPHSSSMRSMHSCKRNEEHSIKPHRRRSNSGDSVHRTVSYESKPWRTIYQSRRAHGDVICQSYLESLQGLSSQRQRTPTRVSPPWGSLSATPTTTDQTKLTPLASQSSRSLHCVEFGKDQL